MFRMNQWAIESHYNDAGDWHGGYDARLRNIRDYLPIKPAPKVKNDVISTKTHTVIMIDAHVFEGAQRPSFNQHSSVIMFINKQQNTDTIQIFITSSHTVLEIHYEKETNVLALLVEPWF